MLVNLSLPPFQTLNKLATHQVYSFYLCGSRYFNYARPDSDWDFFVQDDEKVKNWLLFQQFKRIPMHPSWFDTLAEGIYRHQTGVEVAVVTNAALKYKACRYLKFDRVDLLNRLKEDNNDEKRLIWNYVYSHLLNEESKNASQSKSSS